MIFAQMKERIKQCWRWLGRYGLYLTTFIVTRLPYDVVRGLMRGLIAVGFWIAVRQKKIARESLAVALGDTKTPQEREEILRSCFTNFGKGMIELIYFMAHPALISSHVVLEGQERLDAALSQGKGVVVISAHFGNFPLMLLYLAQRGYPVHAIIRRTRDEKIEAYFQKLRSGLGLKTIYSHPRQECVSASLKALRHNEIVFIPLDQNFGTGKGVFVNFFGQQAATATGPVVFALRTGSPIVPMFMVRSCDDTHRVIVDEPMILEKQVDEKQTTLHNVQRMTQVIERYIREYPQEWGWMHRRWKSRPRQEAHDE